jgi:hypothetical protein
MGLSGTMLVMITEIGIIAGEIWQYLDKHDSATLDNLAEGTGKPRELVLMSLGWLAREGHINLGDERSGYVAKLTSSSRT